MVARAGAPGIAQLLAQTEEAQFAEAPQRRAPLEPPLRLATDASPTPVVERPIEAPIAVAAEARTASLWDAIEARAMRPQPPAEAPPTPLFKPLPAPPAEPRPEAPIAVSIVVSAAVQ